MKRPVSADFSPSITFTIAGQLFGVPVDLRGGVLDPLQVVGAVEVEAEGRAEAITHPKPPHA